MLGRYYLKNGVHYLTYIDEQLSRDGLRTTTLLKVYPDHVILARMGNVEQRQEFRLGHKTSSIYVTPYGSMELTVLARQIKTDFRVASGVIDISYDLEVDGQWQSENILSITIQEGQNCGH
ncbi:putative beta-barrel protein YwiB [bioreactor metagenome]|uniref:Putative beta-barrel protein YwiB n=1 Tax=bioreactor metagenome TaxID=1076179 RepID=A0A645IMJ6_9ZZZZ